MRKFFQRLSVPLPKVKVWCTVCVFGSLVVSCTNDELNEASFSNTNEQNATSVTIQNSDFESGKSGWSLADEIATSSVTAGGSGFFDGDQRSMKIKDTGNRLYQTVPVQQNTTYILKSIILGKGSLGAGNGESNVITTDDDIWEEISYTFNSGNGNSILIYGKAYEDDTRFDNFSLTATSTNTGTGTTGNLALDKETSQSSTGYSGASARAVDGNTNGHWGGNSVTHTASEYRPWWQVRLGAEYAIGDITIFNRTDNCCVSRLSNFDVFVYNDVGELAYKTTVVESPSPSITINAGGVLGSRVRIKLKDENPLSLAEVQVFEYTEGSTPTEPTEPTDPVTPVTPTPPKGNGDIPSDLMRNCDQWKITYPTGEEDKTLCGENNNEFFYVNNEKNAIVFRAPVRNDNGTTPNSSYIRSELRERTADGNNDIYWTTEGTHVIYVQQAITHLPKIKSHLVATQIHGNKDDGIDDSMVLRLEEDHLFLSFNGGKLRSDVSIKTGYRLGQMHEVIFEVKDGKHYCYYSEDGNLAAAYQNENASRYLVKDGNSTVLMDLDYDETYFKVGNYTQSNPDREGSATNDADNYGEVVVYDFFVLHNN